MGSSLASRECRAERPASALLDEIPAYAACGGPADSGSAEVRRRLQPGLPLRTWHRVYPFLPKEVRDDGALVVWQPEGRGWQRALERVHAGRPIRWRLSGAFLQREPGGEAVPTDLVAFDDYDLADWSLAVPDPGFRALCGARRVSTLRLSELVARWAFEVGPRVAASVLAGFGRGFA